MPAWIKCFGWLLPVTILALAVLIWAIANVEVSISNHLDITVKSIK